jgi:hypothetical protein
MAVAYPRMRSHADEQRDRDENAAIWTILGYLHLWTSFLGRGWLRRPIAGSAPTYLTLVGLLDRRLGGALYLVWLSVRPGVRRPLHLKDDQHATRLAEAI